MAVGEDNPVDDQDLFYQKYEAKEIIGKGMSSVVRRCVSRGTGEELAVKTIESGENLSAAESERVRLDAISEAHHLQVAAACPHIIELKDFYENPTSLHLVFELAPGGELFDFLSRQVTLSEKKTRSIMRQIFTALLFLHRHRIVHRDIKPENILMIDDDTIKITDFGFAYQLAPDEKLKELVGTPGFLAPEVLRTSMYENAVGYGVEVDLWAAGVIMYTLLAGYAPFFHRRQLQMLRAISEGRYQFRSPDWDRISEEAKDLIRGLLTVEPKERMTAAEALEHPFFLQGRKDEPDAVAPPKFNARGRFKAAIIQVRVLIRLLRVRCVAELVPVSHLLLQPYAHRKIRKSIDAMAFRIYGHWVKKDREQYRDALFGNSPKKDKQKRKRKRSISRHVDFS